MESITFLYMEQDTSYLAHTIKRADIRSHLDEGKGLRETIDSVRSAQPAQEQLVERLLSEVTVPDEQLLQINQHLYEMFHETFPHVVALGIAGGGAEGGMAVRKLLGNLTGTDFDAFAVVSLPVRDKKGRMLHDVLSEEGVALTIAARTEIDRLVADDDPLMEGLPKDFSLCEASRYYGSMIQDISALDYEALVDHLDVEEHDYFDGNVYFLPTYPPEVGQRAAKKMLDTLTRLSHENHPLWVKITSRMKTEWQSTHTIKPKHLDPNADKEHTTDPQYTKDVRANISEELTKPFNALIDATDIPSPSPHMTAEE